MLPLSCFFSIPYIGNAKTFENVWESFKPDEAIPETDFKNLLLLFVRNPHFYNSMHIGEVNVKKTMELFKIVDTFRSRGGAKASAIIKRIEFLY